MMSLPSQLRRAIWACLLWPTAQVVLAAEETASGAGVKSQPMGGGEVLQMLAGLAAVLGAIFVLAWVTRRFNRFNLQGSGALRVLGGLSMGSRERVVLVQAGETQLLIGVAPGRVQTLHVLDKPLAMDNASVTFNGFADRLRTAMKREQA